MISCILYVISQGISSSYANGCYSALRFLYETTLGKDWNMKNIPRSKKQSKLPVVLSRQEVLSIFDSSRMSIFIRQGKVLQVKSPLDLLEDNRDA